MSVTKVSVTKLTQFPTGGKGFRSQARELAVGWQDPVKVRGRRYSPDGRRLGLRIKHSLCLIPSTSVDLDMHLSKSCLLRLYALIVCYVYPEGSRAFGFLWQSAIIASRLSALKHTQMRVMPLCPEVYSQTGAFVFIGSFIMQDIFRLYQRSNRRSTAEAIRLPGWFH